MKQARKSVLIGAFWLIACGDEYHEPDLGQRVKYTVSEFGPDALGTAVLSGHAGGCLPEFTDYSRDMLQELKWAPGTQLEAIVDWPDRRDCGGFSGGCSSVNVKFVSSGTGWRIIRSGSLKNGDVQLRSDGVGEGGFKTTVQGKEFDPPFSLRVVNPTSIWFEQALHDRYGGLIPGAITEIHAPRDSGHSSNCIQGVADCAIFAATFRDSSGEHICGAVPATMTISSPELFSVEPRAKDSPYINLPFRVVAGSTPGTGTVELRSGDLVASLTVIVE